MESSWFNTALVMRKILDNFSHKEILTLTLVNKTWNFVGKSLLKARGNTVAILGTAGKSDEEEEEDCYSTESSDSSSEPDSCEIRSACEDLVDFAKMLKRMTIIPFSGLKINVYHKHPGTCPPIDESTMSWITSKIPISNFAMYTNSYQYPPYESEYEPCNASGVVPVFLKANACRIAEISMVFIADPTIDLKSSFDACGFPHLKVFKFDFEIALRPYSPKYSELLLFLKGIVQSAPTLEEFHLNSFSSSSLSNGAVYNQCLQDLVSQVLDTSQALIVCDQNHTETSKLSSNCWSRLAVREFFLFTSCFDSENHHAWKAMLRNSSTHLQDAKFNIELLSEVLLSGVPMVGLKELRFFFPDRFHDRYAPLFDAILRKSLWKRCFPNLKKLCLCGDAISKGDQILIAELIRRLYSQRDDADGIGSTEQEDTAWLEVESLSHFKLKSFLPQEQCAFFCDLCPRAKYLELVQPGQTSFVPHFYNRLNSVEHLQWSQIYPEENVDWKLCGIHLEEAIELKKEDIEYLKQVNIVPVEPPVTFLKGLKMLTIRTVARGRNCGFSKVAAGICFSRIPGLQVQLMVTTSAGGGDAGKREAFLHVMRDFPDIKTGFFEEPRDARYFVKRY